MKDAWALFKRDVRAVRTNVMASVILFGLLILPLMFTMFNVIASWDPFENTDQLKIAVASEDEGFESDVVAVPIKLGDQVLSELSANDQIDWTLTNPDEALEGTKSGDYYASIILPESFSQDMLTFYTEGAKPATLAVYTNEKKNALGPIITDQAAEGAVSQINESFTEIVNNVGLGVMSSLSDFLNDDETKAAVDRIEARVEGIQQQMKSSSRTVASLGGLVESTVPLVNSASNIVSSAKQQFEGIDLGTSDDGTDIGDTLSNAVGSLTTALEATGQSYGVVGDRIDELFNNADSTSASTADAFDSLSKRVGQQVSLYEGLRDQLNNHVKPIVPLFARAGYNSTLGDLEDAIQRSSDLRDRLAATATDIREGNATAQNSREKSTAALQRAKDAIAEAKDSYNNNLKPQLASLTDSVKTLSADISEVGDAVRNATDTLANTPGSLQDDLSRTGESTKALAAKLAEHSRDLDELLDALHDAGNSGDFSQVAELVGSDPAALAQHLTEPVTVDRKPVGAVASFGTGMTPLYANLALWIGALLTAVIVRVKLDSAAVNGALGDDAAGDDGDDGDDGDNSEDVAADNAESDVAGATTDEAENSNEPSRIAAFFGRFGIFALMGLGQATLVALGLIFFVQIEPEHPFLLWFASCIASLVFMLMIYTLVITFGNAGKALGVLFLIFQVSGANGAYPLPLLSQWFQNLSPWLPATYGIDSMRAAISGVYQADYWVHLGQLLLFAIPTLILGLVLRPLFDGYNKKMDDAMEQSELM